MPFKGSYRGNSEPVQAEDAQRQVEGSGHKKVRNVIIAMAIAINFERIWAYMRANGLDLGLFSFLAILLLMLLSGTLGRARIWGNLTTHWASVG